MGLIPRSNHLSLIKDCYPPAPSSSAPTSEIPSPVSNALGKLSFYAVNRPKKLPKVLNVLLERATKDKHSSGTKARQDLGVTLDIIRGLVVECGENGKDGAGELIKAVAEEALKAAEMGLSGEGGVKGKKRDPEMEAKGTSLVSIDPLLGYTLRRAEGSIHCYSSQQSLPSFLLHSSGCKKDSESSTSDVFR